jgi:membrane-bound serine protease (ClpP class)
VITDPNIAFLLLNLGFVGLLVSFYNGLEPITAVAGVICLIVGLYALNTLPVNYAGAALILLGLGFWWRKPSSCPAACWRWAAWPPLRSAR